MPTPCRNPHTLSLPVLRGSCGLRKPNRRTVTLALTAWVPLELVQKVTGHKTTDIVLKTKIAH